MSRYRGPKIKLMRAVGMNLPGVSRKTIDRKPNPPGMSGTQFKRKKSNFGNQLLEKQKLRFNYGLTEKKMRRLVSEAFNSREHSGHKMIELLERRLDSIVFRAGFAPSIVAARQFVSHNHVLVDGKVVNIGSYRVKPGQVISMSEKGLKMAVVEHSLENLPLARPAWLSFEADKNEAKMITIPDRESFPFAIDESLVVEYYSRMVS